MRTSTPTRWALLAALPLTTLGLAACGDDAAGAGSTAPATGAPGELVVGARDIAFDKKAYESAAGDVSFQYVQKGNIRHTLLIEGVDGFKLEVTRPDDTDSGSVELAAGTYTIYCDVPGHRPTMQATLTVQ